MYTTFIVIFMKQINFFYLQGAVINKLFSFSGMLFTLSV